jgi:pyruvate dehydrogenase E2 component (dihydrolipoamide acetyltransferase)
LRQKNREQNVDGLHTHEPGLVRNYLQCCPFGLVVPVIWPANLKSPGEIAQIRARLTSKAQQGELEPDEMSGGSFTLTNLGMYGIDQFQAIINPPQSVILAVGRIKERPVGEDGQVVLKRIFFLTLSCDHRVLDGAGGAAFLQEVVSLIEDPSPFA